jgi:large subunit ribosomal protein L32
MANEPKKRHSRQRQGKRRASIKLAVETAIICDNCGMRHMPHRVCEHCGFYKKQQVSVFGFAVCYKDENGQSSTKYFDYLLPILSHDSLFIMDCIRKLLDHPFMTRFHDICFWSDSGPHFRSGELMHFIFKKLPAVYNKTFFINYFVEYHGKNIVDGHFGVLSRWVSQGETVQNIYTIDDLLIYFRNKAFIQQTYYNTSFPLIEFDIYQRLYPRTQIHKLVIHNFSSYLCFVKVGDKLFASTLSTLISQDYAEVAFQTKVLKDKRKTKYTLERQAMDVDVPAILGPKSKVTLLKRVELTYADNMVIDP